MSHESMNTSSRNPPIFHDIGLALDFSKPVIKPLVQNVLMDS
ncbi:hypothetical protein B4113_1441 [Geobacillus sp. B4113_201601]|nr:hypothetical protein B4113_1441 [Geobacillus sp. B4113_201601]